MKTTCLGQGTRDKGEGIRRRRDAALRGVMLGHWVTIQEGPYKGEHGIVIADRDGMMTVERRDYKGSLGEVTLPSVATCYELMSAHNEQQRILRRWMDLKLMREHWHSILGHYDRAVVEPSERVLSTCERRAERLGQLRRWLDRRWRESVRHIPGMAGMCRSIVPYAGGAQ